MNDLSYAHGWTWTLALLGFATGVADLYLAWQHGREATITFVVRDLAHRYPVIPLLVGILLGHLFGW